MATCTTCPAGTKRLVKCPAPNPNCIPCEKGTFNPMESNSTECIPCSRRCRIKKETIYQPCSKRSDIICRCSDGLYRRKPTELSCEKHKSCSPGFGVTSLGTYDKDTECTPCAAGTFSNEYSPTQHCQPHTICHRSSVETFPGNTTADRICQPREKLSDEGVAALIISPILLAALILLIVCCKRQRCHRNSRPSEGNDLDTTHRSSDSSSFMQLNISSSEKALNTEISRSEDEEMERNSSSLLSYTSLRSYDEMKEVAAVPSTELVIPSHSESFPQLH